MRGKVFKVVNDLPQVFVPRVKLESGVYFPYQMQTKKVRKSKIE